MIDPKKFPLCEKFIDEINAQFSHKGWITINSSTTACALVHDTKVEQCLQKADWDFLRSDAFPIISSNNDGPFLLDDQYNGIYPFVYERESNGEHSQCVEIIEHFRLIYDLRMTRNESNDIIYVQVDECGEDVPVIQIKGTDVLVSIKYISEYIALRQLNLLIFFDHRESSDKTCSELNISFKENQIDKGENHFINYSNILYPEKDKKTGGWVKGKILIKYHTSNIKKLWLSFDDSYEEFIYGNDNHGYELLATCDESKLSNDFFQKEGVPYTLTPIFFTCNVLDKYHSNPNKYSIKDGEITGPTWILPIDNDREDNLVAVLLCDLGRIPYKEQKHWRQHNIPPRNDSHISETAQDRWFGCRFCNAKKSKDLVLKAKYSDFSKKWYNKYGWYLFKPLNPKDEYLFNSLHCMTVAENDKDFESQILALTKIFIDSINEKELRKSVDTSNPDVIDFLSNNNKKLDSISGISLLEIYLIDIKIDHKKIIEFLKKIQKLRSQEIVHRKSSNRSEIQDVITYFQLDLQKQNIVLDNIMEKFIVMLNILNEAI